MSKFKAGDKVVTPSGRNGIVYVVDPKSNRYSVRIDGRMDYDMFDESDLRAANACRNSTSITSTRPIVQNALERKACNFGSLKIGTRVEVDGRKGTVVANPGNMTRYTVKFDDGKVEDANAMAPYFKVVNSSAVARNADGVAPGSTKEDKELADIVSKLKSSVSWAKTVQAKRNELRLLQNKARSYTDSFRKWEKISNETEKAFNAVRNELDQIHIFWSCDGY